MKSKFHEADVNGALCEAVLGILKEPFSSLHNNVVHIDIVYIYSSVCL